MLAGYCFCKTLVQRFEVLDCLCFKLSAMSKKVILYCLFLICIVCGCKKTTPAAENMNACGTSTGIFINLIIDGHSYSIVSPSDTTQGFAMGTGGPNHEGVIGGMKSDSSVITNLIFLAPQGVIGNYPVSYITLEAPSFSDDIVNHPVNNIPVINITEYGPAGGYIAGNFSGVLYGSTGIAHTIEYCFRVKRLL